MNDYDVDELLHRTDRLLTSFDLSRSETEEVRRLKEDLELADNEIDLADVAQKLAFHERRATSRPATIPRISLHIEHDPTERGLTVPEGSRVLIARRQGKVFETPSSGELFDGDGEERPEGFVVVLPPDGVARPVWRFAGGEAAALRAGLSPDNWSLQAAHAAEGHAALEEVMRSFTNEQAREIFRSMTREELDKATGSEYTGTASRAMGEEVLKRFRDGLEKKGAQVESIPAEDDGPCEWPHAELIPTAPAAVGWRIPIASCGPFQDDVRRGIKQLKYESLYLHQLLALKRLDRCRKSTTPFDVVLTTPTASGKTMAFLPGILSDWAVNNGNALFLYPLRALCHDQICKIHELLRAMGRAEDELHPFYDQAALPNKAPRLIAATPDKINAHLDKDIIQNFLHGLRWLVIDEAHTYKGCFGINVAFLLRRLLFFARSDTRLVLSSATLDNTVTFARKLRVCSKREYLPIMMYEPQTIPF